MTPEERHSEFGRLFSAIPGRNIDKLRKVADILCCKVNTVRIAMLRTDNRKPMTESNLRILRRELEREGLVQPIEGASAEAAGA